MTDFEKETAAERRKPLSTTMRLLHRYIGFFLAGVMAVYAISGIVLIFRETDILKQEHKYERMLLPGLSAENVGKEIKSKNLKFSRLEGDTAFFENGWYNTITGSAAFTKKELPFVMNKLTQLHKASTKSSLYFLNIFFGAALLFFVISSFWMFRPSTRIFKKGIYFTIAGIVLVLVLLFV